MANHYYIISEDKFHRDKNNDSSVWKFVEGTGIDLNSISKSKIPTISQIRQSIVDFGLQITDEYREPSRLELKIINEKNDNLWLIFTDFNIENDETFMFELERGSNFDLAIEFIKHMGLTFGGFLFYCDSGAMSLITPDKNKELIYKEMNK